MAVAPTSTAGVWNHDMKLHHDESDPEPLSGAAGAWQMTTQRPTSPTCAYSPLSGPQRTLNPKTAGGLVPVKLESVFEKFRFNSKPFTETKQMAFDRTVSTFEDQLINDYPVSKGLSEEKAREIVRLLGLAYRAAGEDEEDQKKAAIEIAKKAMDFSDEEPFEFIATRGEPYGAGVDDALIIASFAKIARNTVDAFRSRTESKVVLEESMGRSERDAVGWQSEDADNYADLEARAKLEERRLQEQAVFLGNLMETIQLEKQRMENSISFIMICPQVGSKIPDLYAFLSKLKDNLQARARIKDLKVNAGLLDTLRKNDTQEELLKTLCESDTQEELLAIEGAHLLKTLDFVRAIRRFSVVLGDGESDVKLNCFLEELSKRVQQARLRVTDKSALLKALERKVQQAKMRMEQSSELIHTIKNVLEVDEKMMSFGEAIRQGFLKMKDQQEVRQKKGEAVLCPKVQQAGEADIEYDSGSGTDLDEADSSANDYCILGRRRKANQLRAQAQSHSDASWFHVDRIVDKAAATEVAYDEGSVDRARLEERTSLISERSKKTVDLKGRALLKKRLLSKFTDRPDITKSVFGVDDKKMPFGEAIQCTQKAVESSIDSDSSSDLDEKDFDVDSDTLVVSHARALLARTENKGQREVSGDKAVVLKDAYLVVQE